MKENENVFSKQWLTVINMQKCIHHLMVVLNLAKVYNAFEHNLNEVTIKQQTTVRFQNKFVMPINVNS